MTSRLHPLTRSDCEGLLRTRDVARIAVSTPSGPHVVPVRYALVDTDEAPSVVVAVGSFSLLGTYGDGAMLAFAVDNLDTAGARQTWTVEARGRGQMVHDARDLGRLPAGWSSEDSGARRMFLRIPLTEVTGHCVDAITLAS